MTEARAMAAAKAVRISNNNDNNATTQQRDNADDAKDDTDAVEDEFAVLPCCSASTMQSWLCPATTTPRRLRDGDDGR
jgi:hypothetical protein